MRPLTAVLIAISTVGTIGLPLGDPQFLLEGVVLEASFIALTIISIRRMKYVLIPNIVIASLVIVGNTVSPTHVEIMLSLNPLLNATVLMVGGYVLQTLLIVTTLLEYNKIKYVAKKRAGIM